MAVPTTSQVIPGAHVNIVLKADQRTGRQVQGFVRDVLTRGDHHRGIKVRLTDGRIGRVQSLATTATSESVPKSPSPLLSGPSSGSFDVVQEGPAPSRRWRSRYSDIRLDGPLEPPPQRDLSDYIVPAKPRGKGKGRGKGRTQAGNAEPDDVADAALGTKQAAPASTENPDPTTTSHLPDMRTAMAVCPVCNAFEGDEAAVAHHVSEHFE